MIVSLDANHAMPKDAYTKSNRYKLGLFLITLGHIIFFASLLFPLLGLISLAQAGLLFIIGEVVILSSTFVLGIEGFKTIKNRFFFVFRESYIAPIGRLRHYVGITMFFLNIITNYAIGIFAWLAYTHVSSNKLWGLGYNTQGLLVFSLFVVGEISFLLAIYLLGANWWTRFKRLILWHPDEDTK